VVWSPCATTPTSIGPPSHPLGDWSFAALAHLTHADSPPELARCVQFLNVAALFVTLAFALRFLANFDREVWLWALALVCVNPVAILHHRKIWNVSLLPVFSMLTIAAWWRRDSWPAAFAWGLLGALLGQLHPSGFLFAAALAAWTLLFRRQGVAWTSWFAGSCVGALSILPWLASLPARSAAGQYVVFLGHRIAEVKFWLRWVTQVIGLAINASLEGDFRTFLRWPALAGVDLHLGTVIVAALVCVSSAVFVRATADLWRRRDAWGDLLIGRASPTAFLQQAILVGYGMALTFAGLIVHRHYLIVAFIVPFLWFARLALRPGEGSPRRLALGRGLLASTVVLQAALSLMLLTFIEQRQTIRGDYGPTFGSQARTGTLDVAYTLDHVGIAFRHHARP
jgi:hypothetical protein